MTDLIRKINVFVEKNWKVLLILVLLFSFLFHLKYMNVNKAVWWDEADYLSLGKHYGKGTPEIAAPWRSRLIPMLWAPIFFLGIGEMGIKFLVVLMTVLASYLTFRLGSELFDKKIGLMAAFMVTILAEVIFWATRAGLDIYAMVMWLGIGYCFWMGYVKDKGKWYLIVMGVVLGAGIFAYESVGFAYPFLFVFLFVTERFNFLKKKKFWIIVAAVVIAMLPMAIYNTVEFGNPYPRVFTMISAQMAPEAGPDFQRPVGEQIFEFTQYIRSFNLYMQWPFLVAFLVGLIGFVNMFIGFDYVWKDRNPLLKKYFFIFIWMLTVLLFFGFVQLTPAFYFEPRFMFALYPIMCIVIALGLERMSAFLQKYSPHLAIVAVVAILIAGTYYNVDYGMNMLNAKKDSFAQLPEAGLWLYENTEEGDSLIGCGLTVPILYYSERLMVGLYPSEFSKEAKEKILDVHPKYFIVDLFDPNCRSTLPFDNPDVFSPAQVFFIDAERQQPVFFIFGINYDALAAKEVNSTVL